MPAWAQAAPGDEAGPTSLYSQQPALLLPILQAALPGLPNPRARKIAGEMAGRRRWRGPVVLHPVPTASPMSRG